MLSSNAFRNRMTRPLVVEGARRLSVLEHRRLRSIARVRWENRVSNDQVRRRVLDADKHPLWWLRYVSRIPIHRLTFRAGHGWKQQHSDQAITWCGDVKK